MRLRDWHARELQRNPAYAAASAEVEFVQSLADRVVGARIAAGLTQEELAARAGTTQARISEMETGDGNPTAETIAKVFLALGLSASVVTKPLGTEQVAFEVPSTSTFSELHGALTSAPCGSATVLQEIDPSELENAAYAGIWRLADQRRRVIA